MAAANGPVDPLAERVTELDGRGLEEARRRDRACDRVRRAAAYVLSDVVVVSSDIA